MIKNKIKKKKIGRARLTLEARKVGGEEKFGLVGKATSRRIERRIYGGGRGEVGQGKVGLAGVCIEGDEERHISTRLRTSGSRGRGSRSPAVYHACLRRRRRRRPASASAPPRIPSVLLRSPNPRNRIILDIPFVNEDPRIDRASFPYSSIRGKERIHASNRKARNINQDSEQWSKRERERRDYNGIVTLIELFPSVRTTQNVEENVLEAQWPLEAHPSIPLAMTQRENELERVYLH